VTSTETTATATAHDVVLTKPAQRRLREKAMMGNLTALVAATNNKSLAVSGWTLEAREDQPWTVVDNPPTDETPYTYNLHVVVTYTGSKTPDAYALKSIVNSLALKSHQPSFGSWEVTELDGDEYTRPEFDNDTPTTDDMIGYADVDMPEDFSSYFSHLFGLDAHVSRVRKAIDAAMISGYRNRFHAALVGPPGCGKSDICESLRNALGYDAVMKLDATATTAAGAIKELSEREILPRIIVIEEIEKAPEAAMSFLLGVLDQRSEIRKTTARGTIQRDTKLLAIATVNDVALFRKLQAGALASRFPNTIFFKRPSRETLSLILTREVAKVDGDAKWINPTLDYAEDHGIDDPRRVISLCLCGADAWLDGTYAKELDATSEPEDM
jgi:hypothetical protein